MSMLIRTRRRDTEIMIIVIIFFVAVNFRV